MSLHGSLHWDAGATATSMNFTHQFTPSPADSSAGLSFAFTAPNASVCFKNVSLIQN